MKKLRYGWLDKGIQKYVKALREEGNLDTCYSCSHVMRIGIKLEKFEIWKLKKFLSTHSLFKNIPTSICYSRYRGARSIRDPKWPALEDYWESYADVWIGKKASQQKLIM